MERERIRQTAACWLMVAMGTASAAPQKEEGGMEERWNVRWKTREGGGGVGSR